MNELYSTTSSISPFSAILWCFYPIAILVLVELFLGGGFDDDNDDQDGGMLIPAYSNVKNWALKIPKLEFYNKNKFVY